VNALESRILLIERLLSQIQRDLATANAKAGQAQQQVWAGGWPVGGAGSGTVIPYFFVPTGAIAAATSQPGGGGAPGSLGGQNLYIISGGAWVAGPTGVIVKNWANVAVASGTTACCLANSDGTYSVITQSC
jgi:hypothetical protein